MDKSAKFWDRIAKRYAGKPIADEAAYQKKLKVTQEYLQPDMEALELGCGTGSTALIHAPHVKHLHAIDYSAKMIEIAKRKAERHNITNITFEQMDVDTVSFPDQSLDVVLGLSLLHLLVNKEEVTKRVYNMLKPGGIFVTSTACIADTMKFFKVIAPIGRFVGLMPYLSIFTTEELQGFICDAGFAIDYQWQPGKGKAVFIVAKRVM
jgi:ubiquinone/menaquinone biosynthesis C-methylase UbiE